MKKILIFSFVFILLVGIVSASALSTLWKQGVSAANPQAARVISAADSIMEIQSLAQCVTGIGASACMQTIMEQKAMGQVYGEAIKAAGPEVQKIISTYQQLDLYREAGAELVDLKIDENGEIESGIIKPSEEEIEVGDIFGLNKEDIIVKNVELSVFNKKERENSLGVATITFTKKRGYAKIGDSDFKRVMAQDDAGNPTYIELNEGGEIVRANLIASADTSFVFNEIQYDVSEGQHIYYEGGKVKIYGSGWSGEGYSFKFKKKLLDSSGKNKGKYIEVKSLVDFFPISIEEDSQGNYHIDGENFNINGNNIKGVNKNDKGKITLSKNSKIIKVWEKTNAVIDNIKHEVRRGDLDIFYGESCEKYWGENCFSYGQNKISLKGHGFKSILKEGNNIFPELKFTKNIRGTPIQKQGDFEITLDEGFVEIEKDSNSKDLSFNVKHEGDFKIKNGVVTITSYEYNLYAKSDDSRGISHDMNFNNEYKLNGFVLSNKDGSVQVNHNLPWQNTIEKVKNMDIESRDKLKQEIQDNWNIRPRKFFGYMNSEEEEDLVKWVYEATEKANKNKYGVKITPSEVFTTLMLEGVGNPSKYGYMEYEYYNDHYAPVSGFELLGTDFLGDPIEIQRLQSGRFISPNINIIKKNKYNEHGKRVSAGDFNNLKDGLEGLAGVTAHRKYIFEKDFKKYFGEEEFKKLTNDEKYFWTSFYYNSGEGAGKAYLTGAKYKIKKGGKIIEIQGKGREKTYKPFEYREPTTNRNSRINALIRMTTNKWIKETGAFDLF